VRQHFVPYLRCPLTSHRFTLVAFEKAGDHVVAGLLTTPETWYPVIAGVPRLLVGVLKTNLLQAHHDFLKKHGPKMPATVRKEWSRAISTVPDFGAFLSHQKKTAESFAFEWKHIYKENKYEKNNFFHFLSPFVAEQDLKGKITLDVGCGSGRFTKWAALSGTRASIGSDIGETVEVAYEMTKNLPNVCIVQSDIYNMPFRGVFDFVYSIGVLHHLPRPQEGFAGLPMVLKEGGKILIWVYNRRGNARAIYLYEPLRMLARSIPRPILYRLCYIPAVLVEVLNLVTVGLKKLGLTTLATKIPFSYYANFPFNMKLNDAFDVLSTPKSNYYYKKEVEDWFKQSELSGIRGYEHPEAGITCIGEH
jgi:SAM-dependent methyltransferase/uncharacterized protein YbaR (Trm112 family)